MTLRFDLFPTHVARSEVADTVILVWEPVVYPCRVVSFDLAVSLATPEFEEKLFLVSLRAGRYSLIRTPVGSGISIEHLSAEASASRPLLRHVLEQRHDRATLELVDDGQVALASYQQCKMTFECGELVWVPAEDVGVHAESFVDGLTPGQKRAIDANAAAYVDSIRKK